MSGISVSLEGENLTRAQKLLAGISGGMNKALYNAITRTTNTVRTHSSRAISGVYAISIANLRSSVNVKHHLKTSANSIVGEINFSGTRIPLFRYDASPDYPAIDRSRTVAAVINGNWRTVHPGVAVAAHQLRSTRRKAFKRAFVASMGSGHVGIFERTGGATSRGGDAIKEIMGSSYSQMLGRTEVTDEISQKASETFDERMDAEINRILNGF